MTYELPGPKTRAVLQKGLNYFRHGLSYERDAVNAAKQGFLPPAQLLVDRAKGDFVWDLDGNRYIDFQNGWVTNPLGNCNDEVIDAVYKAMKRYGYAWEHPLRFELAEELAKIMPSPKLTRFSFEVSGTEAVESAVHMALCHRKARNIISFTSSYHGESIGTKVISGYNGQNNLYLEPWSGGVIKAPYPYTENIPARMTCDQYGEYCLWFVREHIPRYISPAENIGAVIIEPGLAEGGNWIPSVTFLRGLRDICTENNWVLIIDEVLTGLGRTGKMWAIEHYGIEPDILVAGKSLSGGIEPCAVVAATDEILGDNLRASGGSTFAGTPAGCAAALKTLEIYERENILDRSRKLSQIAESIMSNWAEKYGIVGEVRIFGLIIGVSFQAGESPDKSIHIARSVRDVMMKNGVWAICLVTPTVRIYPALTMSPDNLIKGLCVMEDAIQWVETNGPVTGDYPGLPTGNVGF